MVKHTSIKKTMFLFGPFMHALKFIYLKPPLQIFFLWIWVLVCTQSMIEDEVQMNITKVKQELQWESKKKSIGLSKLRRLFLDPLEVLRNSLIKTTMAQNINLKVVYKGKVAIIKLKLTKSWVQHSALLGKAWKQYKILRVDEKGLSLFCNISELMSIWSPPWVRISLFTYLIVSLMMWKVVHVAFHTWP